MEPQDPDASPRVEEIGTGAPVAAVVGGTHGDEPSGMHAIETILEEVRTGKRSVHNACRFITANPLALRAGKRYIESDLNRSFPGTENGTLEERLAHQICELIADIPTLALHATHARNTPFAFINRDDTTAAELARSISIPNLVLADGEDIGAMSVCGSVLTVETGPQGSQEAIEHATQLTEEFLVATDVFAGQSTESDPTIFEFDSVIDRPEGEEFEVLVENFTRVEAGDPYVRVDGEVLRAETSFYPILLSAYGYEDILGYRGQKLADSFNELG